MRRADPVGEDFDARRSATARSYRYLVWNAPAPDPLLAATAWHVRDPLDLSSMRAASDVFLGTHDFRSFCRRPVGSDPARPLVRRVTSARWSVDVRARGGRCRRRHRRDPVAPLRDHGRLLLPSDGPLPGGQPGRGGTGPGERGRAHGAAAGGQPPPHARSGPRPRPLPDRGGLRALPGRERLAGRRLPEALSWYVGSGTPGTVEAAPGPRSGGCLAHHAEAKDRSCAHIFTEGQRDPAEPGTSSTPTASSSVVWPRRWRRILRGKHRPYFAPHVDTGDHVIVVNADKVILTSNKADAKLAYRHSGYPGGLRSTSYAELLDQKPAELIRRSVRGMLPEEHARPSDAGQAAGLRRPRPPARGPTARDPRTAPGPSRRLSRAAPGRTPPSQCPHH